MSESFRVLTALRPPAGRFATAVLSLLLLAVGAAADPIPTTTIGFHTASGAVGNYYNGGTDAAGNSGPNVGIVANTANPAGGGVLNGLLNPTFSVPNGFTGGFSVEATNVAIGFAINVYAGENGDGPLLAQRGFDLNGDTTASVTFTGTAKSIVLARWSGNPFYDNLTFGSTTVGTPVAEPPAATTSAATGVTSSTATLNGTVNPGGAATTAQFEYGTTTSYGSTASVTLSPNDGTTSQSVSAALTGLLPGTTYYYRLVATNSVGSRNGSGQSFTTLPPPAEALHFDGTNDLISVPHSTNLALTTPFTVEAWIKPEATTEPYPTIFSKNGDYLVMWLDGTRIDARIGAVQLTGPTVTFGTWTHVALTYDGTTGRIYKDGTLAASGTVAAPVANSSPFYIGFWQGFGRPFRGAMDEFRVWTEVRTQSDLQAFKDTELATMPASLVAYYKLNQGVVGGNNAGITTAVDETGGANGTLTNFALTGATSNWTAGSGITAVQATGANAAPSVVAGNATIAVNEGAATSNSLTITDAENNLATVTANVGTVAPLASATYLSEFATTASPRRFDFDAAGNIYVGSASGVVTKYDPTGTQLMQFTIASPSVVADGENFTGIDVDSAGNIYVTYSGHTHTRKYDSSGNLIGNFGPATQQVYIRGGRFGGPSGNYYQLDRSHKLVLVSPSGTELWRTSGYNAGVNEPPNTGLSGNLDVAIHPTTGAAYVGDAGFIKGFDVAGATTGYFNTTGGQIYAIDMDAQGNLWSATGTTIRKYTTAGVALGSFGTAGTGAGQFQFVSCIRFDAAGNLWALDLTRNKLIKFSISQSSYAWVHTPADGPAGPTTVTITATDSLGAAGTATFTLNVNNVAPTATFSKSTNATINEGTASPPSVSFSGQSDPGATDVAAGFKYSYDYDNDGTFDSGDGTYAGGVTAASQTVPATYFAAPAPASLTVRGRILDKDGGFTDYTVAFTVNHAPSAINGPLTIVEDFEYGASAGTLSGNGGAGFSTAWSGGSYAPTGLSFGSLASPGGAWAGGSGSRNFAATLAAAGPISGDFLFSMSSAPSGRVQMFGLGGFNNQGFTIALAPANDSTPTGGVPIVGLNSGGFANITSGPVALNTTYMYRFSYAGSSITAWILTAAQYDNFAPGGLTDAELNAASIGGGPTQVTGRVTKTGNVTGNMANLYTYSFGGSGVTMDRFRLTGMPVGASLVVAENAAVNTSAGTLTASDADSANTFTYSLVSGTGDDDNASFTISGNTVRSAAVFDYEAKSSRSIRVRVTDQGGLSYETPLTVAISNVNEAVTDVALSPSSIPENNAANAAVGTLTAIDGDTGDTHTFTLVSGTGDEDNASFTIAGTSLRLTPVADYETKASYALRVRATDAGGLWVETALTVTVTDVSEFPPVFTGYTLPARKNTAISLGFAKILVNASDPDGGTPAIASVATASAQGGTVTSTSTALTYTPPTDFTGLDSIGIVITDGQGATTAGTIVVNVTAASGGGNTGYNQASLSVAGGQAIMLFYGVPGQAYQVQRSVDLDTWQVLGTPTAGSDGSISFTDPSPPSGGTAYYRTVVP